MKREGRQRGMVRTYAIKPSPQNPTIPDTRIVNKLDSPPTCGIFIKVPKNPTNHSKFTGKCGKARCMGCRLHPTCKSKDKTKGTQRLINSRDLASNYKMITWRVVDGRPGLNFSGFSGTGMLDYLGSDCVDDNVDDDDDDDDDDHDGDDDEIIRETVNRNDDDGKEEYNDEEDEIMSYYDVAFDQVCEEDEGWCLLLG